MTEDDREKIAGRIQEIKVEPSYDEEIPENAVLVCAYREDLVAPHCEAGSCAECGRDIGWSIVAPKAAKKICIGCMAKQLAGLPPGEKISVNVTKKTLDEVEQLLKEGLE